MNFPALRRLGCCGLVLVCGLFAFQRPFRVYPSMEPYDDIPLPSDYQEKTEWVFARLMYPEHPDACFGRYSRCFGGGFDWREGSATWTQDYPRAAAYFARCAAPPDPHPRPLRQPVNPTISTILQLAWMKRR